MKTYIILWTCIRQQRASIKEVEKKNERCLNNTAAVFFSKSPFLDVKNPNLLKNRSFKTQLCCQAMKAQNKDMTRRHKTKFGSE
jgi:predicted phage gp36 major capsid-like protein